MGSTEGSMTEGAQALDLDALAALEAECEAADADMRKWVRVPVKYVHALIAAAREATDGTSSLWRDSAAGWRERAERAEAERDTAQAALARVEALHFEVTVQIIASDGSLTDRVICQTCTLTDGEHILRPEEAVRWPCATIRAVAGEGQEAESHEAKRARRDASMDSLMAEPPQLTRRQMREAREHHDPGTSIGPDVWGDAR